MEKNISSKVPRGRAASRCAGFTLIELLISCFIILVVLGVAFYLFAQVQGATRNSMARTQISVVSLTMDSRLRTDFAGLVGPNANPGSAAGCLLIVPGIREGYLPQPNGQPSPNRVRLRCDQLVFMTKMDAASWLNPTAPAAPWTSLDLPDQNNPAAQINSYEARIWYGAVADASLTPTGGGPDDPTLQAHHWLLGRDCKLIGKLKADGTIDPAFASPLGSLTPDPNSDAATGSLALLADTACGTQTWPGGGTVMRGKTQRNPSIVTPTAATQSGSDWTDTQYVQKMAMSYADPTAIKSAELPQIATQVDLHKLYLAPVNPDISDGVQVADLAGTHLRLIDNCSEIVVQWAGDLDKDGNIDVYPPGHPLAGAIIWYPEEYHATAAKTAMAGSRYSADIRTKYNAIVANPWATQTYPTGFTGPAALRFGTRVWPKDFQFEYNETDGSVADAAGGTIAPTSPLPVVPKPYVFRFEDDQYRLVRFGFRQDGGVYKNVHDGKILPTTSPMPAGNHYFPYPAFAAANPNPSMAVLYNGKTAPAGPYPRAATAAGASGTNFADNMGNNWLTTSSPFGAGPFRTSPSATYPNGQLLLVQPDWQRVIQCAPSAAGNYIMLAINFAAEATPAWNSATAYAAGAQVLSGGKIYSALAANTNSLPPSPNWSYVRKSGEALGTETILSLSSSAYRSEPTVGHLQGQLLTISPSNEPGYGAGTKSATDFTGNGWFSIKLGADATGSERQIQTLSFNGYLTPTYGTGNNYTANYYDLFKEYLYPINVANRQGTRADWRNPQSDWPRLIRIRLRLHDAQGSIVSYSDEALMNGRSDQGDGTVDMATDARISGIWYEYILAVPYPHDPTPRGFPHQP